MKKISVVFAVFTALIFVLSCGGGSKSVNQNDESDTGETVTDGDTADSWSSDTDPSDSGHENPDTNPEQSDNGDSASDDPDNPDTAPDGGDSQPDDGDTEPDNDYPQTPCDPNPCLNVANSTKECIETGDTTYSCKCNSGYNWTGSQCQSNSTPSLPECSASNTGPCYDSTSHLTWSKKADTTYDWSDAGTYCDNLTEGGYSDWRLPNISELRTLIQNCSETQMPGGSCGVIDTGNSSTSCLSSSCWTESACYSCSSDSTGWHSKFGDTGWFWSSSTLSDRTGYAWSVYFNGGSVYGRSNYADYYVRCVR